ncbi:cytochrome p450 benzoate 4-monooxygenase [Aureobasidium pullulans]|uniref:Cytochrome p450 benzoate 4-monooxygenase n=1 Tax=Aureobasidium pullulans TaxID=5580 RepID=A0A4S8V282_AURPU|nr:cytochrome p450 benzoate 4-monooxygenase [Aureobasidium pullulans]THW08633.1 cytochrome p450 benzoate 4-monooxygenase [Aureobasidium pullulans]
MNSSHYVLLCTVFVPLWTILYYVLPYFTTYRSLRNIPGPFLARFSNTWVAYHARQGQKFAAVDRAHRKYGPLVRIGYNHVSIADERGIQTVYAHGNGFLKDHFYEAFVSGVPGVFNTRDRVEHTRKRKIVAHAFSPGAVAAFETHMAENLHRWVTQLDRIAATPAPDGYARVNMMPWCTYIAFDIIGDLAFGAPFGMVDKGRDECEAQLTPNGPITLAAGAETLNRRGEVSSTLGLLLPLKAYAKYLPDPFFSKGLHAIQTLHGIASIAVSKRLDAVEKIDANQNSRHDILDMLVRSKGPDGNPMQRDELTSEALTQLIAGSDTVSNTSCAIIYWILHGERAAPGTILPRLQKELDTAIPNDNTIATHAQVKSLPFLHRCIDEGMRIHSTSALGLPRIVTSPQGFTFTSASTASTHFPAGTVLSVPSYTVHHSASIWGPDVETFNPDRFLPDRLTASQKMAFNPFSHGPRACVGQNVAGMELGLIVGTLFRRYEMVLRQDGLESMEGFSKKPESCWVGIRRRA